MTQAKAQKRAQAGSKNIRDDRTSGIQEESPYKNNRRNKHKRDAKTSGMQEQSRYKNNCRNKRKRDTNKHDAKTSIETSAHSRLQFQPFGRENGYTKQE